jgi:hypothetical protein
VFDENFIYLFNYLSDEEVFDLCHEPWALTNPKITKLTNKFITNTNTTYTITPGLPILFH